MPDDFALAEVRYLRDRRYHRLPELALRTEQDALSFVENVGFSFLFPVQGLELPSLWEAISGGQRRVPGRHDDLALDLTWEWKDTLPSRRALYYGKLLKRKPTLVALDLLPYFYALSDNCGEPDDYLQNYQDGKLSEEAKRVYEALLEHGPQPTSRLRVLAGMPARQGASRFDRAISELQGGLYIVKTGISDANAWKYCYVYDLFWRRFPEAVELARSVQGKRARLVLAARYLRTVVASPVSELARLFEWSTFTVEGTVTQLLAQGIAEPLKAEDRGTDWLRAVDLDEGVPA